MYAGFVTWVDGDTGWIWDSIKQGSVKKNVYAPVVLTERKREIMPLVRQWRSMPWVKSVQVKRVQILDRKQNNQ